MRLRSNTVDLLRGKFNVLRTGSTLSRNDDGKIVVGDSSELLSISFNTHNETNDDHSPGKRSSVNLSVEQPFINVPK